MLSELRVQPFPLGNALAEEVRLILLVAESDLTKLNFLSKHVSCCLGHNEVHELFHLC